MIYPNDSIPPNLYKHPALIDASSDHVITYGKLLENVKALSTALYHQVSLRPADVILLYGPNSSHFPTVMLSGLRIGCSISPSNPLYQVHELAHQLRDSKAKVLFTSKAGLSIARQAAELVGLSNQKIFILSDDLDNVDGHETMAKLIKDSTRFPLVKPKQYSENEIMSGTPAFLCYSSGTTGLSKGVETTHDNIAFNCAQVQSLEKYSTKTVLMATLPMYHMYLLQIGLMQGLWQKSTLIIQERFHLQDFLQYIQKYKVTKAHIVPPIVLQMAKDPLVAKYDLSSLKECVVAAAPLGKEISHQFRKRLAGIEIKQAYGMTEMSPISHMTPSSNIIDGSVGCLVPNTQAKIIDVDGNVLGYNQEGELLVKGRMVMKGYLNNPPATALAIDEEGYLHTGDLAICRENGYFEIVDRLKELIKFKGFPVVPAELEALLISHPEILDASVIGIKDEECGELPKAFCVRKPGSKVTGQEVQDFIASRVAHYKKLRGGVEFIDKIPKSAAGKILRRLLRA